MKMKFLPRLDTGDDRRVSKEEFTSPAMTAALEKVNLNVVFEKFYF